MMSQAEMEQAMSSVRDQILEVMDQHELLSHGGKPCVANRSSVVAYIAHCIGVNGEAWKYAEHLRQEYDRSCRFENCTHTDAERN